MDQSDVERGVYLILVAWQASALSEGQAARALGVDRVTLREIRDRLVAQGAGIADELIRKSRKGL